MGLLVWIFNGTFFGGLAMGLMTFFLLGSLLVWGICEGRGGVKEDAEVLGNSHAPPTGTNAGSVLDRAEQAVVDAGSAFASGAAAAAAKGRDALHEFREGSGDGDDSLLDRAEDRLEQAGEKIRDVVGNLTVRSKEMLVPVTDGGAGKEDTDGGKVGLAALDGQDTSASSGSVAAPDPGPVKPARAKPAAKPKKKAKAPDVDNLKEIKGVGPALENLLHENGITSFAQIAAWTDADIDHYAELIGRMGGRIRSDDWVAQARVLARGDETEFSRRVDKGEVY